MTLFTIVLILCLYQGEQALIIFIVLVNLILLWGDRYLPHDNSEPKIQYPKLCLIPLYLQLPLMLCLMMTMSLIVSLQTVSWGYYFGMIYMVGLAIGAGATVPAHELIHHTRLPVSKELGRWLLALSLNHAFYVEHLYGHHKNVALSVDPVSSKINQPFYCYLIPSVVGQVVEAWQLQRQIAQRHGTPWWAQSLFHSVMRALVVLLMVWLVGGIAALTLYLCCVLFAKVLLELINYIQHYGLERQPEQSVENKHSWNSNHCISSWFLFNLTRHSQHHMSASRPYWLALANPKAERSLRYGYLTTLYLALLLPRVFFRVVEKKSETVSL